MQLQGWTTTPKQIMLEYTLLYTYISSTFSYSLNYHHKAYNSHIYITHYIMYQHPHRTLAVWNYLSSYRFTLYRCLLYTHMHLTVWSYPSPTHASHCVNLPSTTHASRRVILPLFTHVCHYVNLPSITHASHRVILPSPTHVSHCVNFHSVLI